LHKSVWGPGPPRLPSWIKEVGRGSEGEKERDGKGKERRGKEGKKREGNTLSPSFKIFWLLPCYCVKLGSRPVAAFGRAACIGSIEARKST